MYSAGRNVPVKREDVLEHTSLSESLLPNARPSLQYNQGNLHDNQRTKGLRKATSIALFALTTAAGLALLSIVLWYGVIAALGPTVNSRAGNTSASSRWCGNSSEEAIARGCRMEGMSYAWMPPQCFYDSLSSQYQPFTSREWFIEDHNKTRTIVSPTDLEMGRFSEVWAAGYHTSHCLFLWTKLSYAIENRMPLVDVRTANYEHTRHCARSIDWTPEAPGAIVKVVLRFYDCVELPWDDTVE